MRDLDFILGLVFGYLCQALYVRVRDRRARERIQREIDRLSGEPKNALGLVAPAWPTNDPTWTPRPSIHGLDSASMPTWLRHRKAPNSGIISCGHGNNPVYCAAAECVAMRRRLMLALPDDA